MTTIQEQLQQNSQDYRDVVREIRENWELSDEAKRQRVAEAHQRASHNHNLLVRNFRQGLEQDFHTRQREMFAAPKIGNDNATNIMAYRDALDRTSGLEDAQALVYMMDQAALVGDSSLLKACLLRGYNHPIEEQRQVLIDRYFGHVPEDAQAWGEWMDTAQSLQTLSELGPELALGVPAPQDPYSNDAAMAGVAAGQDDGVAAGMSAFEQALGQQPQQQDSGQQGDQGQVQQAS